MQILHIAEFGLENLVVEDAADPVAGPGEVLIAMEAAAISHADVAVVSGAAAARIPPGSPRPYTPGWDLCGTVVAHGFGVQAPPIGSRVVGFSLWFATGRGTQASLVAMPASDVAVAPDGLSPARLTTVGLNGLTAWHCVEQTNTGRGRTLVIVGAGGAVGGFALELAVYRGASVIAVVGSADRDAVLSRGAMDVVVREDGDSAAAVLRRLPGGVDAVLDTASVAGAMVPAVRDGGRFVTTTITPPAERGITVVRADGLPNSPALAEMLQLATEEVLSTPVAARFALGDAQAAYRAFMAQPSGGRIVLVVDGRG